MSSSPKPTKVIVGISGASGSLYGKLLLERLSSLPTGLEDLAVIFTDNGRKVWAYELEEEAKPASACREYENNDLFAPPASGSAGYELMIICPCSMGMLGRIAHGVSNDLLTRAADVMLKERRKLILVTREMPYSLIHIRNMELLTLAGAIICPASPAFYHRPQSLQEAALSVVEKVMALAGYEEGNFRWGAI